MWGMVVARLLLRWTPMASNGRNEAVARHLHVAQADIHTELIQSLEREKEEIETRVRAIARLSEERANGLEQLKVLRELAERLMEDGEAKEAAIAELEARLEEQTARSAELQKTLTAREEELRR